MFYSFTTGFYQTLQLVLVLANYVCVFSMESHFPSPSVHFPMFKGEMLKPDHPATAAVAHSSCGCSHRISYLDTCMVFIAWVINKAKDSTTTTSCRVCLIEQTGFSVCNASKIQTQRLTLVISPWLRCSGMHLTQGSQSMLQRPGCGNTVPELCQDSGQGHILIRASREGPGVLLPGPQDEKTLPFLGSFFFKTRIISLNPFLKKLAIRRLNTILET